MGASCCAIRAVDREYAASAYGGYTHPTGTATAATRTSDHAAGAGPPRLCSADRKNSYDGTVDHAGTVTTADPHSDRAIDGKYAATAHGRCAHPVRSEAAAERTNANTAGTGATRVCAAGKEIPC